MILAGGMGLTRLLGGTLYGVRPLIRWRRCGVNELPCSEVSDSSRQAPLRNRIRLSNWQPSFSSELSRPISWPR